MPRYKLTIEYDGTPFCGWQRQDNGRGVQQAVEEALRTLEPDAPSIMAAGRTDAGVHATGQVAHCDLARDWHADRLCRALDHFLHPEPVSIVMAERVAEDFHARFDARARHYLYRVLARPARPALLGGLVWHVHKPLDGEAMRAGAAHLIGKHDFTTFRSARCQSLSPVKTLDALDIAEVDGEFRFHVRARSFLHNQVRSFVGTLVQVGAGRWHPDRVAEALAATDRAACGTVAPPQGLYLERVIY